VVNSALTPRKAAKRPNCLTRSVTMTAGGIETEDS
jgi:hypothetical protein